MTISQATRQLTTTFLIPSTISLYHQTSKSLCDSTTTTTSPSNPRFDDINLRKRMTSIGRFSLQSETVENPSVPTFFIAMTSPSSSGGMDKNEFTSLWSKRDLFQTHPRFHFRVSDDETHFEPTNLDVREYVRETVHYGVYREDLKKRIEEMLMTSLDVNHKLWEAKISSGKVGSSGAISGKKVMDKREGEVETVVLFRTHHSMADGVSLGAALSDLSDEAEQIHSTIHSHFQNRLQTTTQQSLLTKLSRFLRKLFWFCFGSIHSLLHHSYLLFTTRNPFQPFLEDEDDSTNARSVSWCDAAPIDEAKRVAKTLSKNATINDLFVTCISKAILKQLKEHHHSSITPSSDVDSSIPSSVNVVIPVHLTGGINPPGQSMGNRIGAMVTRLPLGENDEGNHSAEEQLRTISDSLTRAKTSPAPFVGYLMARLSSNLLPQTWTQWLMKTMNANSVAVISNVRGPEFQLHWNGRTIQSMAGFVPIPPGVPIGVVIQSYAGILSLSVTADTRAVPDADKFLGWVLEEYQRLCVEARTKSG